MVEARVALADAQMILHCARLNRKGSFLLNYKLADDHLIFLSFYKLQCSFVESWTIGQNATS